MTDKSPKDDRQIDLERIKKELERDKQRAWADRERKDRGVPDE